MKERIKKSFIIPLLGIIGLAVILGQGSIQSLKALPALIQGSELFAEDPTLRILVQPLTPEESKKYLKTDSMKFGYRPLQITIENQSPDPYLIDPNGFSLPLIDSGKVASKTKHSSLGASIGLKIAGFIFWPFSIPSTMHGIKALQTYQHYKRDLAIKTVKEEIIPPYTTMNRVFFVLDDDYKDSYSITLENQETLEPKVFHITELGFPKEGEIALTINPTPIPQENYYLTHTG